MPACRSVWRIARLTMIFAPRVLVAIGSNKPRDLRVTRLIADPNDRITALVACVAAW